MADHLGGQRPFRVRPDTAVVFAGQSLNNNPNSASSYPSQVMAGRGLPWMNVAINSHSWTNLAVDLGLDPFGQHATTIGVFLGGESDITPEGNDGATTYADLLTYVALCRVAGCGPVVFCTIPPWVGITAGDETARTDYNALVLAAVIQGDADAVVDLAAVAVLTDPSNATYYSDGLHWTQAGAAAAAAAVGPVLDTLT